MSGDLSQQLFAEVPLLATVVEAARILRVCERTIREMGMDGRIRIVRIGRAVRYCVREFLQKQYSNVHQ